MMYEHAGAERVMGLIPTDRALSVLDIGPGFGFWGYTLKAHLDHEPSLTGVELNPGAYERLKRLGLYDTLYLGDARTIPERKFWENSRFDLALLSHVVEHMKKTEVVSLLLYLRGTCDQVIIICPERAHLSEHPEPGFSHVSRWRKKDFERLGMHTLKIDYSHRAGRVVSYFERFYFWLKAGRGGVIIAWWERHTLKEELAP
jgi:hypothetical protein